MSLREDINIIEARSPEEFDRKYKEFRIGKIRIKDIKYAVTPLSSGQVIYSALIVTGT